MASAFVKVGHRLQHGGRRHIRLTYSFQIEVDTVRPSDDSDGGSVVRYRPRCAADTSRYGALIARAVEWQNAHLVVNSSRYVCWCRGG